MVACHCSVVDATLQKNNIFSKLQHTDNTLLKVKMAGEVANFLLQRSVVGLLYPVLQCTCGLVYDLL